MRVLNRIFASKAEREQRAREAKLADPVIERLVAATDRRLALVEGYRERLRAPVVAAHEHVTAMIARIPGPIEVSPAAWSGDERLRPLFSHAVDAAAAYSEDESVRAFFAANPARDCFGMLALQQAERRVLTTVQHGESMQAEVARTTVSFSEPQILAPAADEVAVRTELVARALEYLALRAMEGVGAMRAGKHELEQERALLRAQLALAERRGAGLGAVASSHASAAVPSRAEIENDLARTVGELEQAASRNLLPALLDELLAALSRLEEHLTIEPCALALDAMNFAVAPSPRAVTPCVAIMRLARRPMPFAVLIARFPRAELRERDNRLAEAAKYL